MKICIYITNFKNDLIEAISKTAVGMAVMINEQAECVLYTPGEIAADSLPEAPLENISYAPSRNYHSKIRVLQNIINMRRFMRSRPGDFGIVHFHVGNLLELFLIRIFIPKLDAVRMVTVWQPYLGIREFFRLPWVFRSHLSGIAHHYLFNSWLLAPLFWFGAGYFHRIVLHSRHQKKQLPFISDQKILVVENGVPIPSLSAERTKNNPPGILYIGHATAVKGLDVLLAALGRIQKHSTFHVTLALTEFQNVNAENLVRRNGLEQWVTIKGDVDVIDEMQSHEVLIVPHKTSIGTSCYPNIVIEAFSAGIPVVASRTDVLEEIIEDGITGFLVPPGDVTALENILTKILNAPEMIDSMPEKQREIFRQRFTLNRYVERHLKIYSDLMTLFPTTLTSKVP